MANVSTVKDVQDADADDIIKHFTGTITRFLGDYKSGTNKNGEWSFQHVLVKDADGDEIKLTLKNRDEMSKKLKGKTITVSAHKGKNDWSGLYAKDDEYNGETKRILQATATAEIEEGEGDGGSDRDSDRDNDRGNDRDSDRSSRRERNNDRPERSDRKEREPEKEEADPVEQVTDQLLREANLYGMCLDTAHSTLRMHEQRNDVTVPPENIYSTATAMYIQLHKEGFGSNLPTEPLWEDEKEPEPEPESDKPKKRTK